ncbi:TetR/AcrR family transcriptional regulator [Streptomyces sp. NPDC001502]|uniref:TetR/AcrR family transcriptional regulator n=1 Tax=Streptomyces sp. NPDC001502 TaxID=3364578 RepID=UPI0036C5DA6C
MERMTGDERRKQILQIASEEFSHGGYYGTSVETIARKAGISQPYVFRIFDTKKGLFISVVENSFNLVVASFDQSADGLTGVDALVAMGDRYRSLVRDRLFLLIQLHGFAASDDPDIRAAVQTGFGRMWNAIQKNSGADDVTVKRFLALGMMLNDMAAMDLWNLDEPWAKACVASLPVESWAG